ncbi:acyltransferase [Aliivibrio sp. S2TY2]|uniref:acyltransferase family protein n=1 Tax=unclassified Aliivibrio TaxID=2645654 RepID=UPI002379A197|nr:MULTISPECIES: acyltransferase [unclassified Aliivibrio]MDD9174940.1 acyltransferase [Aliivibrio sp. S3TY1]MDD9192113.1 acyltransferase [Aliivibrio sp. S2TY2]
MHNLNTTTHSHINNRLYALDWLRVIAAIAVVLFHYIPLLNQDTLPIWLAPFQYGYFGVEIFFMISGFVILMSAEGASTWSFFTSRVTRIYPALWICASITAISALLIVNDKYEVSIAQYLANLTLLHRQFSQSHLDGVYWTLTIELRFYLLIGVFIWLKKLDKLPVFLNLWLLVCAFSLATKENPSKLLYWGSYFIAGAYFYYIHKHGLALKRILPLSIALCCSLYQAYDYTKGDLSQTTAMAIIFVAYCLFAVIIFYTSSWQPNPMFAKITVIGGAMTYPLYLVHQNAGIVLFNLLPDWVSPLAKIGMVCVIMLLLAFIIAHYLEKPLSKKVKQGLVSLRERQLKKKPEIPSIKRA